MKDFDIVKYLRENKQGAYGMFNGYVDLKPLKEEETEVELNTEIPYEGPEHKLAGDGTEFKQAEIVSEYESDDYFVDTNRMMDLGGNRIEQGIISLIDDGFEPEDILSLCKMFVKDHTDARAQGKRF